MFPALPNNAGKRRSIPKTRPGNTAGEEQQGAAQNLPSFPRLTPHALTSLPILPGHIPTHYVKPLGLIESASVALDMLDAGMLTDTTSALPAQMIENSMGEWFKEITSCLTVFSPQMEMTSALQYLEDGLDEEAAREIFKFEGDKRLAFGVSFQEWEWFSLKEKIEAFELKIPGLGETAIDKMDKVLGPLCQAVTPCFTLGALCETWYGEDDESVLLDEYADCGENPDDLDIIRRAQFDAIYPKMSYQSTERLDKDALTSLLSNSDQEVAELADLLLEVDLVGDYITPVYPQAIADDHLPTITPAVCVAWSENDLTVRIVDDYYNREMENSATDIHALWMFPQSVEGLISAKRNIEKYVSRLKWAEKLLLKIATISK